jgi:hypothetical protein
VEGRRNWRMEVLRAHPRPRGHPRPQRESDQSTFVTAEGEEEAIVPLRRRLAWRCCVSFNRRRPERRTVEGRRNWRMEVLRAHPRPRGHPRVRGSLGGLPFASCVVPPPFDAPDAAGRDEICIRPQRESDAPRRSSTKRSVERNAASPSQAPPQWDDRFLLSFSCGCARAFGPSGAGGRDFASTEGGGARAARSSSSGNSVRTLSHIHKICGSGSYDAPKRYRKSPRRGGHRPAVRERRGAAAAATQRLREASRSV